jgi:ligand-binding sensor domain-containing protein
MWIGTLKGLHKFDAENWYIYTKKEGLPHNSVTCLYEDKRGTIWVGTVLGMSKIVDGNVIPLGKKNGCSKFYFYGVNCMLEDSQNRFWVGATNLVLFENDEWKLYTDKEDAIYKSGVHSIIEDSTGSIWVATAKIKGGGMWGSNTDVNDGGISRYDGESWRVFTEKDGLLAPNRCIFKQHLTDKDGNMWFGSCHTKSLIAGMKGVGSLMKFDGEKWTAFTNKNGPIDDCVTSMLEDHLGKLWIGTLRGVSVYDGSSWQDYSQDDTLSSNRVTVMIKDSRENIWIGTTNGLCMYDGNKWHKYLEGKELPDRVVTVIHEDQNGNIWVGTGDGLTKGGGVSKYDGQKWTTYTQENELVSKVVYWIEEDSRGDLWFITLNGISKFTPENTMYQTDIQ